MSAGLSVSSRVPDGPSDPAVGRSRLPGPPVLVPLVWLLVLGVWAAAVLGTGTSVTDLLTWLAAVLLGVLLPGFAVVRAVRPGTAALIEDLGWAAAAGSVVALATWAVDIALPVPVPPWVGGPVVAALTLATARTRSRVLARPAPGWGIGPNLVLAGALLVAIAWMTTDFLALNPPAPGPAGHPYYPDVIYQLALVSEARQAFVMQYPLVAGEPYPYHFFASAVAAQLSTGTGVDVFDAVLRLAPSSLLVAVLLLVAVVAKQVSGRIGAGPIAAVLLAVLGTTVATVWTADGAALPTPQTYWWASLTAAFGWLAAVAAAGCAVAVLRRSSGADCGIPAALFVPLLLLAAGAKSATLPVLLGGAGLALLAALLVRQRALLIRAALVFGAVAAVLLAALLTLYRGSSSGLQPHPGALPETRAASLWPGLLGSAGTPPTLLVLLAAVLLIGPLLPRMVGLLLLPGRDPASWFFVGSLVAGIAGLLAFRHPGHSEIYFQVAAYPVAVIGSAWGIAVLLAHRPWRVAGAVGLALGAAATGLTALLAGRTPPMTEWLATHDRAPTAAEVGPVTQVLWWAGPLALLVAVLAGVAVLGWLGARLLGRARSVPVLVLGLVLGTGLLSTGLYLTGQAGAPTLSRGVQASNALVVTEDELAAGRWLGQHAGADDVLAVNRVCLQRQTSPQLPRPCTAKAFTMAATAQRSVEVGGWAYASRNVDESWAAGIWYPLMPFWDQQRLTDELTAFAEPSAELLDRLHQRGVRWLVAQDGGTPPDPAALDRLADRALTLPTVTVWRLRQPAS